MVENIVFCFNQTINTLAQIKDGAIIIHWTLEEWLLTLSEWVSLIKVIHKGKNSHLTYSQKLPAGSKPSVSPDLIKGESMEQLTFEANPNCEMKNTRIEELNDIFSTVHTKSIFSKCCLPKKQFSTLDDRSQILFHTIVCWKTSISINVSHNVAYMVNGVRNESSMKNQASDVKMSDDLIKHLPFSFNLIDI